MQWHGNRVFLADRGCGCNCRSKKSIFVTGFIFADNGIFKMDRLIKFFRTASALVFIGVSLYVYAILPTEVFVFHLDDEPILVERGTFFYNSLAVFFFVNLLIFAAEFYIGRTGAGKTLRALSLWLTSFAGVLNLFFTLSLAAVFSLNEDAGLSTGALFYSGITLVILCLLSLPFVFRKTSVAL